MGHRGSRSAPPPPPPRVARVERSLAAVIGPALEAALRRVHDDAVAAAADAPPHPRANELAQLRAQLLAYDWHRSTRSLTGDTFLRSARVRAQQVSVRFARTPLVQVVGARGAGKTAFIDTLLRALFAQRFTPVVPGVHTLHVRTYMGGETCFRVQDTRGFAMSGAQSSIEWQREFEQEFAALLTGCVRSTERMRRMSDGKCESDTDAAAAAAAGAAAEPPRALPPTGVHAAASTRLPHVLVWVVSALDLLADSDADGSGESVMRTAVWRAVHYARATLGLTIVTVITCVDAAERTHQDAERRARERAAMLNSDAAECVFVVRNYCDSRSEPDVDTDLAALRVLACALRHAERVMSERVARVAAHLPRQASGRAAHGSAANDDA